MFKEYQKIDETPYCFGLTFNKFDTAKDDYEVEFHFTKEALPDTNQPAFNQYIKSPDLQSWNMYKNTGSMAVYPYIAEFIARAKTSTAYDQATPLYKQQMGYSPMSSVKFQDVSPLALQQLSMNYPFFFMIIQLIPFYYITSKIASEKESKSREGMKMMGLQDSTYFMAWFILFFTISFVTAIIVTIMSNWIF